MWIAGCSQLRPPGLWSLFTSCPYHGLAKLAISKVDAKVLPILELLRYFTSEAFSRCFI